MNQKYYVWSPSRGCIVTKILMIVTSNHRTIYFLSANSSHVIFPMPNILFFFNPHLRTFFHYFREREKTGAEGERKREKEREYERETLIGCLSPVPTPTGD